METILVIFALGVAVSLVVAKGVMQANDYAREKLERQETEIPGDKIQE